MRLSCQALGNRSRVCRSTAVPPELAQICLGLLALGGQGASQTILLIGMAEVTM